MAFRFETLWNTPGGVAVDRAVRRSTWPARMGVTSALLVGVLPLLLVVITALAAGAAVYAVCSMLAKIGDLFTGGRDGTAPETTVHDPLRKNVRVVPRA